MRAFVISLLLFFSTAAYGKVVFIEAESFENKGGWIIDPQFMDIMGSPYLMAHGTGVPVQDAVTSVDVPSGGKYKVWVRTKNWTGKFTDAPAPGLFRIFVNGSDAGLFGNGKSEWAWQEGGTIKLSKGKSVILLKDMTGFNGRVDAIILSSSASFRPPENPAELSHLRKKLLGLPDVPPSAGNFDLVVAGGGIAGICASVAAARSGLKVALIQNRPVLGGNNSSEVRVILAGKTQRGKYPALGNIVAELESQKEQDVTSGEFYRDDKKLALVKAEKNISLYLNTHVFAARTSGNRIVSISAKNVINSEELTFTAPLFADCTGDANLGYLVNADFRTGSESFRETGESSAPDTSSGQVLGAGLFWHSKDTGKPETFPDCPWAYQFTEESCQHSKMSSWNWETGFSADMVFDAEEIRDNYLRAVFGNWSFQKNKCIHRKNYENYRISELGYILGKRESRRMLGDVILTQTDLDGQKEYEDGAVQVDWGIDIHIPSPENSKYFPGNEFRSVARHTPSLPFNVPYRCFYSRNIENLFMAGRHISTTHIAHAATRVQRSTGTYGEVVGLAAALCIKLNAYPRELYNSHLAKLKEVLTAGVPGAPNK